MFNSWGGQPSCLVKADDRLRLLVAATFLRHHAPEHVPDDVPRLLQLLMPGEQDQTDRDNPGHGLRVADGKAWRPYDSTGVPSEVMLSSRRHRYGILEALRDCGLGHPFDQGFWGLRHIEKTPADLYRLDSSR